MPLRPLWVCFEEQPETLLSGPHDSRDWQYIDFGEVYNCLRGSRKLKIPPNWRGVIPDRLGWCEIRTFPLWSKKNRFLISPKGFWAWHIFGSNILKLCFLIFFHGNCRGSDFGVRQPVINPWPTRDLPVITLMSPRKSWVKRKTRIFPTHDQPVINPWFTHDYPWFSSRKFMGWGMELKLETGNSIAVRPQ